MLLALEHLLRLLKYPVKTSKNKIKTLYHDYIILTKDRKTLIDKIEDGIWKNLYKYHVCITEKKKSKLYLQEHFKKDMKHKCNLGSLRGKSVVMSEIMPNV